MTKRAGTGGAAAGRRPAYEIVASILTDRGCVREGNEDAGRLFRPGDPAAQGERGTLVVVADGMGGHASGEVASQMAVELVSRLYYESEGGASEALREAIEEANRRVYAASLEDDAWRGMGTTCTALALLGGRAFAAHVGDSRLYMRRGGQFYLLTEDHSAVMEMVKLGIITREQARTHEDKNVILRALGTAPEVEVSMIEPFEVREGDQYLLCSDGLYDMVGDEEIEAVLAGSGDAHGACERLVALAKERGGHDNITVGVVAVVPEGAAGEGEDVRATREVEAAR